ncbi:MAG: LamG domain-containing protein, partial [Candidatus Micrarchaeota archaeon]|nr:LamG domain-containing protein [Candidatus Micrarchaeota archaeon]
WTILAIAIVMVSLYSLGIFNLQSLAPTATPGSCQVIKTAAQTGLAGQCDNMVPKYVGQFNGGNSLVSTPTSRMPSVANPNFTYSTWTEFPNVPSGSGVLFYGTIDFVGGSSQFLCGYIENGQNVFMCAGQGNGYPQINFNTPSANTWYNYVVTYNGVMLTAYVNGKLVAGPTTATVSINPITNLYIGKTSPWFSGSGYMYGQIANVQIYNASLDNTTIKKLYQEGIGGAPIILNSLVGWWPLNGNANDYSGNNNQGAATNVTWNANWRSSYISPTT